MSSPLCTGFSFDERLGIYMVVQASCLSAAAVLILLSYAFARWLKRRGNGVLDSDASGSHLFRALMIGDIIQAIGSMPSIVWMRQGHIAEGATCTTQAVLKQIGINTVALASLLIALENFAVLILDWRLHRHASKLGVLFICVFIALAVGIPNAVHRNDRYYGAGPNSYWCWIVEDFKVARIMTEYLWVWLSAVIMAILYGVMFLVMRGFLVIENGIHWVGSRRVVPALAASANEEELAARDMAGRLLYYPFVYILCILPNSLSRWLSFSGHDVPFQFTLFANAIFAFSGLFNVILYFSTRKDYAVGASAGPALMATLPPGNSAEGLSPHSKGVSDDPYANGELVELDVRYNTRADTYQVGAAGQGIIGNVLHHSPQTRMLSLGHPTHSSHSGSAIGHLTVTEPSRGGTSTRSYHSADDEDYGRLPN